MSLMSTQCREQLYRGIKPIFVHFVHSAQGKLPYEHSLDIKEASIEPGLLVTDEASIRQPATLFYSAFRFQVHTDKMNSIHDNRCDSSIPLASISFGTFCFLGWHLEQLRCSVSHVAELVIWALLHLYLLNIIIPRLCLMHDISLCTL